MRPLSAHTMSSAPKWRDNPNKYPAKAIQHTNIPPRRYYQEFYIARQDQNDRRTSAVKRAKFWV